MALTAKQQAQVSKAPQARKAALRAMFNRQNSNQGKANDGKKQARPKQLAARVPNAPRQLPWAFDAFDKRHLPVDETTAPYATTNLVNVMEFSSSTSMDQVIVVAPRVWVGVTTNDYLVAQQGVLSAYIAMLYDAAEIIGGSLPHLASLRSNVLDQPPPTATMQHFSQRGRIHNMSVRLCCLGTNTGLYPPGSVYLGTVPALETYLGSTSLTVKSAWAEDAIAVGYIKPFSAASLVEKPVVLHSAVAESVSYKSWRDFVVPQSTTALGSLPFSTALEPIVLYIPRAGSGTTAVNYRIEVGQQWCTRHPNNIMMRATQKQHAATTPAVWNGAVNAIKDIGEHFLAHAANQAVGAAAAAGRQAILGLARP